MMFPSLLLVVCGLSLVRGQSCSGTLTIETQSDADAALGSCSTYDGDVIISNAASGTITLNGIEEITGDLACDNATQLSSLTSDQLNTIGGDFHLTSLTILSTLQFDSLTRVNEIYWVGLPSLQGLNFAQGVQAANELTISNTQLYTLSGIDLTTAGSLDINNNPYLSNVTMNTLTNITGALNFASNAGNFEVVMSNLGSANNITLRNVTSVSMPVLTNTQGSIGIYNGGMNYISFPSLTETGGTLAVSDCGELSSLHLAKLTQIGGGFAIIDNPSYTSISVPSLKVVVGALYFVGDISSVSLPDVEDVRGGMNVTSSSAKLNCATLKSASTAGIIKGLFSCTSEFKVSGGPSGSASSAASSSSTSSGASSSSTGFVQGGGGSSSSSGLSGGAYAGIAIGAVAAMLLAGLAVWYCVWKPRRQRVKESKSQNGYTIPTDRSELPQGRHHEKSELQSDPNHVSELDGDKKHTLHHEVGKETVGDFPTQPRPSQRENGYSSRILSPHELAWDEYRPSLEGDSLQEMPAVRSPTDTSSPSMNTSELAERGSTVKRKPVEVGSDLTSRSGDAATTGTHP